jgi:hypothetical protein
MYVFIQKMIFIIERKQYKAMDRKYIRSIVEEVLREAANGDEWVKLVYDQLNDAHRRLNEAQRKIMMAGGSESDTFKRIYACDNAILDMLNGR